MLMHPVIHLQQNQIVEYALLKSFKLIILLDLL